MCALIRRTEQCSTHTRRLMCCVRCADAIETTPRGLCTLCLCININIYIVAFASVSFFPQLFPMKRRRTWQRAAAKDTQKKSSCNQHLFFSALHTPPLLPPHFSCNCSERFGLKISELFIKVPELSPLLFLRAAHHLLDGGATPYLSPW